MPNTGENRKAGFTLLEIMLAMLVLGMVVAMVSLSLSGSIKTIDSTLDQGDIYYRAQVALERIREDLASAVLPADVGFRGGTREDDTGEMDVLSFASMAHIVFDQESGQAGMAVIGYSVRPDTSNEQQLLLLRSDVLYLPGQEQSVTTQDVELFLLTDRLRSVRFAFISQDGATVESWNTRDAEQGEEQQTRLPAAVSCRLEFWLDQDEETSIAFETTVVLPVGVIQAKSDQEEKSAS